MNTETTKQHNNMWLAQITTQHVYNQKQFACMFKKPKLHNWQVLWLGERF